MSVKLDSVPIVNLISDCAICKQRLGSNNWPGKNNVISVLHNSSAHSCHYHEKCIRAWAGKQGEKSNHCPQCTRPISNVAFYKISKKGSATRVERPALQIYEPTENKNAHVDTLNALIDLEERIDNVAHAVVTCFFLCAFTGAWLYFD